MPDAITLPGFNDMHGHLREGPILARVAAFRERCSNRVLCMPNLADPVADVNMARMYRQEILACLDPHCTPLMTIKLLPSTTPETIEDAADDCVAVKLYPEGVTTNSHDGITRDMLDSLIRGPSNAAEHLFLANLAAIERTGMRFLCHGEHPGEVVSRRERAFLPYLEAILTRYPRIRMVMEHITTIQAAKKVARLHALYGGRIAATITPHHMMHTDDDFRGGKLHPYLFVKPCLQDPWDRDYLVKAATSGYPAFFLGSDDAYHTAENKVSECGCAGIWNLPVLAETLAEIFERAGTLDRLADFTSGFSNRFYGMEPLERTITLVKTPCRVPERLSGSVPYRAGEVIPWSLAT